MAFGFEVQTSDGVKDVFGVDSVRLIRIYNAGSVTGSATISEFDSTKGEFNMVNNSTKRLPVATWNNTTKVVTWSKHPPPSGSSYLPNSAYSTNFSILFWHRI